MKFILLAFLTCVCIPLAEAPAQTQSPKRSRPDFSGVWAVDQTKEGKNSFPEPSEMNLIISQQEPVITMRRTFELDGRQQEQELVYYTDQRGEANLTLSGGKTKSASRTRWEGDRLVTSYDPYSVKIAGSGIDGRMEVEWRILKGGEVLIKRITMNHRTGTSVDASISAADLRNPRIMPPTIVLERAYKRVH